MAQAQTENTAPARPSHVTVISGSGANFFTRPAGQALCVAVSIGIAVLRIASSYQTLSATIDEPPHLACGIEWLQKGVYNYETLHPPLARVSLALGPYLAGVRDPGTMKMWSAGTALMSQGNYWRNLTLARIGMLPYFILATIVVFLFTRRTFGVPAALVAAMVFTSLPVVLAHSGVATTDVPFTAFFLAAIYAFTRWLKTPNLRTAGLFGAATGLAVVSKFSTLLFLPAAMLGILALYFAAGERGLRMLLRSSGMVVVCAFLVAWPVYRFSHAPLNQITHVPDSVAKTVFGGSSFVTRAVTSITAAVPVPAPEFFDGLREFARIHNAGQRSYLLGHVGDRGWWYFFLVALLVKTPLAVLLLAAIATYSIASGWFRRRRYNWEAAVPVVAALMLLIVTAPALINIGIRHILPIYGFVAMLAGMGAVFLWNSGKSSHALSAIRVATIILLAWGVVSPAWSHPDYLAYFNEIGGQRPEEHPILVVSDLDWGQDLGRLGVYLRAEHAERLSMAYLTYFDSRALGLPETTSLTCRVPATGWVAVEERLYRLYPECYGWLAGRSLTARIGKTMRVYRIAESSAALQF